MRELGCNWELGFLRVFLCTIVFSLIIVKSLQLCGRRQIAKSRKYCLVRVIVFFGMCFLYFFLVSHRLGIWVNSLHLLHGDSTLLVDVFGVYTSEWRYG